MDESGTLPRIAVVEDDADLRDSLGEYLARRGYPVWGVDSAEAFYRRQVAEPIDVVLLDLGLPGEDGFTTARHLCANTRLTVIIITARSALEDRLRGMEYGAAGYLIKPIALREVQAVIEAAWRRCDADAADAPASRNAPTWRFDRKRWTLTAPDGNRLALSGAEYALIEALTHHPVEAVPREALLRAIGETTLEPTDRKLNIIFSRLRAKFRGSPHPLPVRAVRGHGYLFDAAVSTDEGEPPRRNHEHSG